MRKRAERLIDCAETVVSIANGDCPDCAPIELMPENRTVIQSGDVEHALRVSANTESLLEDILEKRDQLTRRSGRISSLTQAIRSIREAEQETKRAVRRQSELKKILQVVRAQRHLFSKRLLTNGASLTET